MANNHTKREKAPLVEILNNASLQLLQIKEEKDIYSILVSAITKIVPGIYCAVSKLQTDDMNFRIVHTCGLENFMQAIKLLLGKDPYEMNFPFKDLADEHRLGFDSRKLYHLEDGLYGLTVGAINKTLCNAIEKVIGISDIYATSFYLDDHFFGGLSLFIPKRVMNSGIMDEEAILAIETLSNFASVLIQKQRFNDELKIKNFALDVSPVAVGLADLNGILFFANEAFVKLWGYTCKEDVLGKHVSTFAFSKEQVHDVLNTIKEGNVYWGEGHSVRLNGTTFDSIISATMVKHEKVSLCLMAAFTDITEQKVIEKKLQDLLLSKDKFFSIIAHDLKSPFNTFLGFSELLANEYEIINEKERLLYINMLRDSAVNTFKLLENLLEWSRLQINTYEFHKEHFSLKNLVDECIALYAATAEKKHLTIINLIPAQVNMFVDGNSIKTVFRNLLNNALKYTYEGGFVTFTSQLREGVVEISIQDTGIGINPEILEKLFQVGENISTPGTKKEKGTGLGLILSKELVERNDGCIHVESKVGIGTTFIVQLAQPKG